MLISLAIVLAAATGLPRPSHLRPDGRPEFLAGPLSPAASGTPEAIARDFARREEATLGAAELGAARVDALSGGAHVVRLPQTVSGLPVLGGELVVRVEADGSVTWAANALQAVAAPDAPPLFSLVDAAKLAIAAAPFAIRDHALEMARGRLAALPDAGRARLVYQLDLAPVFPTDWSRLTVDATTGELLARTPLARYGRPAFSTAKVFASGAAAELGRQSDGTFTETSTTQVTLDVDQSGPLHATSAPAVDGWNCCAWGNCDKSGHTPLPPVKGTIQLFGMTINISATLCEEKQVANSLDNATGDFVYVPSKEPTATTPVPTAGIDSEPFAEVNVFHHVKQMIVYFQGLDGAFHLSPTANPLRATANFTFPDLSHMPSFDPTTGTATIVGLMRVDNSMFLQASDLTQIIPVPGLTVDPTTSPSWLKQDSVILFEGKEVNWGYDASVVDHEFTHAVVHAYPDLGGYVIDAQGALDSPGALNEAYADYFSSAKRNSPTVGEYAFKHVALAKGESIARNLAGAHKCPDDLDGEVHDDSRFYSEALWQGRGLLGTDAGLAAKFDVAVFDGLKALPQSPSFDGAAMATLTALAGAGFSTAQVAMVQTIFHDRGVVGCTRVVGTLPPRLFLAGVKEIPALTPVAPAPLQLKLTVPAATATTELSGMAAGTLPIPSMFGGGGATLEGWASADAEVLWPTSGALTPSTPSATSTGNFTLDVPTPTDCAPRTYYLAIANATAGMNAGDPGPQQVLSNVTVTFKPDAAKAASCAGSGGSTGSTGATGTTGGAGGDVGKPKASGCGCSSNGSAAGLFGFAALVLVARRRRRA